MRILSRWAVLAAAAGVLASVPACGGGAGSGSGSGSGAPPGTGDSAGKGGKPRVAVVTNCIADFWSICEAGAAKAGNDFGADVSFRMPQNNAVPDQMEIVDAEMKKGLSGIAVSVINPDEQTAALKRIGKTTNFLAMDNDAPESGRKCYIGVDNYEAGKAVGRMIKKALPNGGTVALFIGSMASANAKNRVGGVLDELAGQKGASLTAGSQLGKYKLDDIHIDDAVETKAQDKAKDVIERLKGTPDLALIGLYAYNPKAILLAARAKGVVGKVKIVGFDEDDLTLEGVEKGEIVGTVVQDPFNYGYKSVEVLVALSKGDTSKLDQGNVPYRLVTKDGGPTEVVNGLSIQNIKATDFAASLKAAIASAKK